MVASPANPTGTILTRDELAGLSTAIKARHGHLVVDEIYHGLTYGTDAASVLQVDDGAFVLNSFSKYFGMTGWRLGWLVAPDAAVSELEKLAQNLYISAPSMAQHAALACFEPATIAIFEERRAEFGRRRDYLCQRCVSWASTLPSSLKERFICMPISASSAAMPSRSVSISSKPSTLPSRRGWILAVTKPVTTCVLPTRKTFGRLQEAVERIARGLKSWQG